jgi:Flp pilus assembly protein TadG
MNRLRGTSDAGQATVEFALVLPLFVMMVVAIFDVTSIVRDQLLVDLLARDAARRASQAASMPDAHDAVADAVARAGRDDAQWRVDVDDDSLRVTVSLVPRASMLATSARWFGVSQHVVGSARFATEFEIAER